MVNVLTIYQTRKFDPYALRFDLLFIPAPDLMCFKAWCNDRKGICR